MDVDFGIGFHGNQFCWSEEADQCDSPVLGSFDQFVGPVKTDEPGFLGVIEGGPLGWRIIVGHRSVE